MMLRESTFKWRPGSRAACRARPVTGANSLLAQLTC